MLTAKSWSDYTREIGQQEFLLENAYNDRQNMQNIFLTHHLKKNIEKVLSNLKEHWNISNFNTIYKIRHGYDPTIVNMDEKKLELKDCHFYPNIAIYILRGRDVQCAMF